MYGMYGMYVCMYVCMVCTDEEDDSVLKTFTVRMYVCVFVPLVRAKGAALQNPLACKVDLTWPALSLSLSLSLAL